MSTSSKHESKGRQLGDAYVRCMPEISGFAADVWAQLSQATTPENPDKGT
jgi:histidine ammonia-lyase